MIGTMRIENLSKTYPVKQRKGLFKAERNSVEAVSDLLPGSKVLLVVRASDTTYTWIKPLGLATFDQVIRISSIHDSDKNTWLDMTSQVW